MKKALFSIFAVMMVMLLGMHSTNDPSIVNAAPPIATSTPPHDVLFKMADGVVIKGTFYPSAASNPAPAVLLLHQYNGNRRQWDPFTVVLAANGYNVLAIDQRGFGETGGTMDWTRAQKDATDLMTWLRQQPTVNPDEVAVVGASIGSNLALRVCALDPKCHTSIALSPALDYVGLTTKGAVTSMHDKAIFLVASERDANPSADGVKALTAVAPIDLTVMTKIYGSKQLHGTDMLQYPDLIPMMLMWLNNYTSHSAWWAE